MADDPTPDPAAGGTPDPVAPPWTAGTIDSATGAFAKDWHTKAPADEAEMWQEYKDSLSPFDIIRNERQRRTEAQTALRTKQDTAKGLPSKPEGDAATPEAWKAYREARGLPADHTGYGLVRPADYPAELWNEAETEAFAKLALDAELSPDQVKALTTWYQGRGREALAAHQTAVAAQKALEEKARTDYIQVQKESLHQAHGIHVDRDLKLIAKLTEASGLDPEVLNPDNPEKFVGADVVKAMASLVAMLPRSGDPTARLLGRAGAPEGRGREYWKNLKQGDPDLEALSNTAHPRHATVRAERDAAYAQDAAQREAGR